jgi:hypothetical protein
MALLAADHQQNQQTVKGYDQFCNSPLTLQNTSFQREKKERSKSVSKSITTSCVQITNSGLVTGLVVIMSSPDDERVVPRQPR